MQPSWFDRLVRALAGSSKSKRRRPRNKQLFLEGLEDRRLMATRIWDGGATINDKWTNKNNWVGNVAPLAGDDLVFPAGIGSLDRGTNNDFPTDTLFRSIRIEGADYKLSGNRIKLSGDLINAPQEQPGLGNQSEVRLGIRFTTGPHVILTDTNQADIVEWAISGQISDDGSAGSLTYRFAGPDSVLFTLGGKQANTYDQPIRVESLVATSAFFLHKEDGVAAFSGPLTISNVAVLVAEGFSGRRRSVGQLKPGLPVTLFSTGSLSIASEQLGPLAMNQGNLTVISDAERGDAPASVLTGTITVTGGNSGIGGFSSGSLLRLTTLVGGSREFNVATGSQLNINAVLDDGTLRKTGAGTLVLSPSGLPNRHDATLVLAGQLRVGGGANEKLAIPNRLEVGGGSGSATASVLVQQLSANAIANDATVVVRERGDLIAGVDDVFKSLEVVRGSVRVEKSLDIVENITMTGGTIDAETTEGRVLLRGNLTTLANNVAANIKGVLELKDGERVVTVADGAAQNDLLITAAIRNQTGTSGKFPSLTKAGPGTLTLGGSNTYRGTTTVSAGVLNVAGDNDPAQGQYIVDGGFMTGSGSVSSLLVKNGALNPAVGSGIFEVLGQTVFNSSGRFAVNINGTTQGSQFDVLRTGSLDLDTDATATTHPVLNPLLGFTPALGDRFRIVEIDGTTPLPVDQVFQTNGGVALTEGKTFQVNNQDFTITYLGGNGNDVVLVRNTGPAFANRAITPEIVEGGRVFITGHITEPNPNDTFFLDVDWGDGATNTYRFLPGSPRDVKVGHRYLDDPVGSFDQYQVKLRWRDQFGGANSAVLTTIVHNDAPDLGKITASLPPLLVGQPILVRAPIWDSGQLDSFKVHVRWDANGPWQSISLSAGSTSFTLKHTYATAGLHKVTVLVIDDDLDFDQLEFVLNVTA